MNCRRSVNDANGELFVGCSYLVCQVRWLLSLPYLIFECRAMPFGTTDVTHKLDLLSLAFLALVQVTLDVRERSCAACRAESWVLHWMCRLEMCEGEQGVLCGYNKKPDKYPFIELLVQMMS